MSEMTSAKQDIIRPSRRVLVGLAIAMAIGVSALLGAIFGATELTALAIGFVVSVCLVLYLAVEFPAVFVGLLQGGMALLPAILVPLNVFVPDGLTIVGVSVLCVLGLAATIMRQPKRLNVFVRPVAQFVFAFTILVVLSVTYSWNDESLNKAILFVMANLVSFMVASILDVRQRRLLYQVFYVVAFVVAAGIIVNFFSGSRGAIAGRYQAFDIDVIGSSRMVGLGIIVAVYSPLKSRFRFPILFILGAAFVLAGTRGPLVALLVAILFAPLLVGATSISSFLSRRSLSLILAIVIAAFTVIAIAGTNPTILVTENWGPLRIINDTNLSDNNILERSNYLILSIRDFTERPLLGWGIGGFGGSENGRNPTTLVFPHNLTMETMAELGIVGLALLVLFLVFAFAGARKIYRINHPNYLGKEVLFVSAVLTYALVNAHISGLIHTNRTVWLAIGLLEAIAFSSRVLSRSNHLESRSLAVTDNSIG